MHKLLEGDAHSAFGALAWQALSKRVSQAATRVSCQKTEERAGGLLNVSQHRAAAAGGGGQDSCPRCMHEPRSQPLAVRARTAPISGGSYRKESGMEQSLGLGAAGWLWPPCWS